MNFEYYSPIATRCTARRFITFQVNCIYYVADCKRIYTLLANVRVMAEVYSGTFLLWRKLEPSIYTAVQVTDLLSYCWQTATHSFEQIQVQ